MFPVMIRQPHVKVLPNITYDVDERAHVANESVCASHLGKCGNEGETLVCHVQAFMRCLLPRIVFLGIGVQSRWQIAYEAKHMFETDRVQVP